MKIDRNPLLILFTFCLLFLVRPDASPQSGREVATIRIGSQIWMAQNLNVDRYWDGRPIPEAKTIKEWNYYNEHKIGCWCNYDNEGCYGSMYGKLYNWYAIRQNVAPRCWRLASKADFDKLIGYLGESKAGKQLKATHSWNNTTNGTNQSGWGAFAGGCRNILGYFSYVGRQGFWWTNDARKDNNAGLFVSITSDDIVSYEISEGFGYSVRCVRDAGFPAPEPCP